MVSRQSQPRRCRLATLATSGLAQAADLPVKAAKKAADLPFFLVIDNRVTFSWMPKGTDPGMWSVNPNGSINGTTAKQVYSFTHFDALGLRHQLLHHLDVQVGP